MAGAAAARGGGAPGRRRRAAAPGGGGGGASGASSAGVVTLPAAVSARCAPERARATRARLTVLLELPERAAGCRGCRAMLEPLARLAAADVALRAFSKWWLDGAEPVYHGWPSMRT